MQFSQIHFSCELLTPQTPLWCIGAQFPQARCCCYGFRSNQDFTKQICSPHAQTNLKLELSFSEADIESLICASINCYLGRKKWFTPFPWVFVQTAKQELITSAPCKTYFNYIDTTLCNLQINLYNIRYKMRTKISGKDTTNRFSKIGCISGVGLK